MGLDFSHGDAHWSYGGFSEFRERLARCIGVDLPAMLGFGGKRSWDGVTDPIGALLHHSDCDGVLSPDECARIAPRLREVVEPWEKDYDRENALLLAQGMEQASSQGAFLEFC